MNPVLTIPNREVGAMIPPSPLAIKWLPRTWLKHILTFAFFSAPVLKHFLPSTEKQMQLHRLQVPINSEVQRLRWASSALCHVTPSPSILLSDAPAATLNAWDVALFCFYFLLHQVERVAADGI